MSTKENHTIKGKRILLFCSRFYDYDVAMRDELLRMGAADVYLCEIKWISSLRQPMTAVNFLGWIKNPWRRTQWTNELKSELKDKKFDIFLCIPLPTFKKTFLSWLRKMNPNIKIVLFMWDKWSAIGTHYSDYYKLFDRVISFDRDEAKKYNIEYFPDFYLPLDNSISEYEYDISFIGTFSGKPSLKRPSLLKYIQEFCDDNNLKHFLFLRFNSPTSGKNSLLSKKIKTWIYKRQGLLEVVEKYKDCSFLKDKGLTLDEVKRIQNNSRIIIDLSHPNRQGMTINAITALATDKKLITTNKRIQEESFYDPNSILIIDEDDPKIPMSFIVGESSSINLQYLRLDHWLEFVLGDTH